MGDFNEIFVAAVDFACNHFLSYTSMDRNALFPQLNRRKKVSFTFEGFQTLRLFVF